MKSLERRLNRLEDRLAPSPDNRLSSRYAMPARSSRWTAARVYRSFATPGTSIQRAPSVSWTLPIPDGLNAAELEK
jgi:hypothetical protein